MPEKRAEMKQARRLCMEQNLTQKEIANKLGISEKTMSRWVKMHGWKTTYKKSVIMEDGNASLLQLTGIVDISAFAIYLRQADPNCYKVALMHLSTYIYLKSF